ncbi:MAG: VCBS repeat-containing protein [Lentisphaeria bacterium]|nr:VCBS repeat-containing protein [Lentisphaeria bacterium]
MIMFRVLFCILVCGSLTAPAAVPVSDDCVLRLEFAGDLLDTGGNAARSDGIARGGVGTFVPVDLPGTCVGSDGWALAFDGVDDSVAFPSETGTEAELRFMGTQPFTVFVRLWLDRLDGIQHLFSRWPDGHSLFHQNSLCFAARPEGPHRFVGVTVPVEPGRWYDVACVYSGPGRNNLNLYLHETVTGAFLEHNATTLDRPIKPDTRELTLGSRGDADHFAGRIERVLAFRRALSADEVHALTTEREWDYRPGETERFGDVRVLRYAEDVLAPFAGPAHAADWDGDGHVDLLGSRSLHRNTGRTDAAGLPIFETPVAIDLPGTVRGDLDGDGDADVVTAHRDGFRWYAPENQNGGVRFVNRGDLQHPLGRAVPLPESGEGVPWPALVDWDGDGRVDLLSGTRSVGLSRYLPSQGPGFQRGWADGSWYFRDMTATLFLHRNVGSVGEPLFTDGELLTTGAFGRAITFFDTVMPVPVDWNDDGLADLLVGTFDRVVVFLHAGSARQPRLDEGHVLTFAGRDTTTFERRPVFPFRGSDGLWRLNVGGSMVRQARQLSAEDPYAFGPLGLLHVRGGEVRLANFSVPDAADWDGDGRQDMVVGTEDGFVWFVRNLDPSGGVSAWAAPVAVEADGEPIRPVNVGHLQGPCEWWWGYTNPCVTDWDGDGDPDLILGYVGETFLFYENVGTATQPALTARGNLRCATGDVVTAWRTRPGVGDLDGDGLTDLVGVDGERLLTWWRRERDGRGGLGLAAPAHLTTADERPIVACGTVRGTGRTKLAVCDWDRDGVMDILASPTVHNRKGAQVFCRGLGARDGVPRFRVDANRIVTDYTGHYTMAEPVDFDGDGAWEILSGRDSGQLQYWRSSGAMGSQARE